MHRLAAASLVAVLAALPAAAQPDGRAPQAELEEVERSLESARTRAGRLAEEYESAAGEQAELQDKLIDTAARIQHREQLIGDGEERLAELALEDEELRDQLGARRSAMADMLGALQKLEREPPPVLAVRPGDAVAAIRSAMLLANVVPQIRAEADGLSRALRRLASVRGEIIEEQRQQTLNQTQLEREREVIERLLEVKSELVERTASERAEAQRRAEQLAAEARSLRDLLAALEEERRRAEEAERALLEAEAAESGDETRLAALEQEEPPSAEERRLAMARPDRLKPAIDFAESRGALSMPAIGQVTRAFGADDGYGGTSKGISIETRPSAQVTAPNDGWVVYAGEFRGYGQLLIIDGGDGYHVLLAGMSRIDAALGQFVLAGEPVGVMGLRPARSAAIGVTSEQSKPVLYVEFRKEGESIDPQPWWVAANVKARG